MTWLAELFPEARDRLGELEAELWADGRLDPTILQVCRRRLEQLLGVGDGQPVEAPDERTKAALAFTELYVIDAHAVTDEVCASLRSHFTEAEVVALTMALATFDATTRMRVVFE